MNGKDLYIQFINSYFPPDLILFETVYTKWIFDDLYFLGIINDSTALDLTKYNSEKVIFIERDYNDLCSIFNLDTKNGFYYLVNKEGKVTNSGKNDLGYERGPKILLQELLKNNFFSISEIIIENEKIANHKWFNQVNNLIQNENDKEYFLISLYTTICYSCSGGKIIRALKDIHRKDKNETIYILSIISRRYKEQDIHNLKTLLKIPHPVIRANNELDSKWNSLIEQYREDYLTDIVFLVDKSGTILKIAHTNCDCYPSFFTYVYDLITKEK
jgi:hypothetical protein